MQLVCFFSRARLGVHDIASVSGTLFFMSLWQIIAGDQALIDAVTYQASFPG
jgi:hypothetical protein